jgi:fibronectin type 3 domain-containing protein
MTVAFGAAGAPVYSTGNPAPSYPTGVTAGQYILLFVATKPESATSTTPAGFTLLGSYLTSQGEGDILASGIDEGPMLIEVFGREAASALSGTVTVTNASNNVSAAVIARFTKTAAAWEIGIVGGKDVDSDSTWGVTATTDIAVRNGDCLVAATTFPTDTNPTWSSEVLRDFNTATNFVATPTLMTTLTSSQGQDVGGRIVHGIVANHATDAQRTIQWSATHATAITSNHGPAAIVRLREVNTPAAPGSAPTVALGAPGSITITGTAVTDATSYNFYRAGVLMGNQAGLVWTDNAAPVTSTTTYTYAAVNAAGTSAQSPASSAIAADPKPPTPVTATPGNASVALAWSDLAETQTYKVYREASASLGSSDDFNRADNTSLGASWVQTSGTDLQISSNQVLGTTNSSHLARWATTPSTLEVFSQIELINPDSGSTRIMPAVGIPTYAGGTSYNSVNGNFYYLAWGVTLVVIYRRNAGTGVLTSVASTSSVPSLAAGDVIRLEWLASGELVGYHNGVERLRGDDSTAPLGHTSRAVGLFAVNHTLKTADNWRGGSLRGTLVHTTAANATSFNDTGLTNGTEYTYSVTTSVATPTARESGGTVLRSTPTSVVNYNPTASSDDGYAQPSASVFNNASSIMSVGRSAGGAQEIRSFVRFPGIALAQGAVPVSAALRLRSSLVGGATAVRIRAYAADNAAAPTTVSEVMTTAQTVAFASQTVSAQSTDYTFDVKSIVEEVVGRAGWVSGNAICFTIGDETDTGDVSASFETFDIGGSGTIPRLAIDPPAAGGSALTHSASDGAGLVDARALDVTDAESDSESLADARAIDTGLARSDSAGLTDAAVAERLLADSRADGAGLTDSAATQLILNYSVTDTLGATDSRVIDVALSRTDTEAGTDSRAHDVTLARADNAAPTDAAAKTVDLARSDNAAPTDAAAPQLVVTYTVTDSIGVTDTRAIDVALARTDVEGATDTRALDIALSRTEDVAPTDVTAKTLELARSDNAVLTDAATTDLTGVGGSQFVWTYQVLVG